jgi:hypothetical protein
LPISIHRDIPGQRRGEALWFTTEAGQDQLEPVFSLYCKRTGRPIDLIGYTRFPPGTLAPLVQAARDLLLTQAPPEAVNEISRFISVCAQLDADGASLIFVGD